MTYEMKLRAYREKMANMAGLETLTVKFHIASGNAGAAGHFARRAAQWVLISRPDLREVVAV